MKSTQAVRASSVTLWLQKTNPFWFALFTAGAAFSVYTCVYVLRKAFSVATFEGISYFNISYKVWLVTFQVMGYALSKFIGIKIISELQAHSRAKGIALMVLIASVSLFLFAITPPPYNIIFLFTNGLPLGMVWGMLFGYLEGRRSTEVLGAGLSVSFIFSAGFAKTVGSYIILWGAAEHWMPFIAACLFTIPLFCFLWLLDQVPPPSLADEQLRTKRQPMNQAERKNFILNFLPGIIMFTFAYILMTTFRDFRDNFSPEVWKALGYGNSPQLFTTTEIPITIAVLMVMGSIMAIKNNKTALLVNHIIIIAGMLLIGVATFLFERHFISPIAWMMSIGLGLYLGYVPFNSIFFDRMLATFQYVGTVGFIMYVADSFGYLGSVGVLLFKEFGFATISWLNFFILSGYFISIAGSVLILGSLIYFQTKKRKNSISVEGLPA